MLSLHEELLLELRRLISTAADRPVNSSGNPKRSKQGRWNSFETLEGVVGEKATKAIRRSLDVTWFGRGRHYTSVTVPKEAADIARVFERMV